MKYTFTAGQRITVTEVGDFFRLLSTVGPVTVEYYVQGREIAERIDVEAGYAESFRTIKFDRVDITSDTAQLVQWETALGSQIRYDRGAATISGTVGLDSATLLALEQVTPVPIEAGANWKNSGAMVANTPLTIFTPGSNTNGAIIWTASAIDILASLGSQVFIAKTSAPTTSVDGEVIAGPVMTASSYSSTTLAGAQRIAAGLGLYFISSLAGNANGHRAARYTLL